MKFSRMRTISLLMVFALSVVGVVVHAGTGGLSSFGIGDMSLICPLGALESLFASKSIVVHVLIALAVAVVLVMVFGKAFCSWICLVPPLRDVFARKRKEPSAGEGARNGCGSCLSRRGNIDSRHVVLAGALLSAAVFGFPVFCLVCPVGLVLGVILVVWQWVTTGTVGWSLLAFPAILLCEVVFFRKWCSKICPLGALLSLISLSNCLFRPRVVRATCLEEQGAQCGLCASACPEGLDPHSNAGMNECSKCGACADVCPTHAVSIVVVPKKGC